MPPSAPIITDVRAARPPAAGPPLLRRRPAPPRPPSARLRAGLNYLLIFVTVVLVVDALIGEQGFMDTLRVRRQWRELARSVDDLRRENAALAEQARRLREDPAALEAVAREEHGLIRPGEIVFILKNVTPADARRAE